MIYQIKKKFRYQYSSDFGYPHEYPLSYYYLVFNKNKIINIYLKCVCFMPIMRYVYIILY